MEVNDGFGIEIGSLSEVINAPIGAEAADDGGTWRGAEGEECSSHPLVSSSVATA